MQRLMAANGIGAKRGGKPWRTTGTQPGRKATGGSDETAARERSRGRYPSALVAPPCQSVYVIVLPGVQGASVPNGG